MSWSGHAPPLPVLTNIYIDYDPLATGTGCVPPRVKIEFGARSTGEPFEERLITCDATKHLPDLEFPAAQPRVMLPKRTFWEKATAVHVYCGRGTQGDRYSRHWHDLVRLDDASYAQEAFDDRALAKEVAEFKGKFFRARDSKGNPIDYVAAVAGALQLVPDAAILKTLEADYKKMADGRTPGQGSLTVPWHPSPTQKKPNPNATVISAAP